MVNRSSAIETAANHSFVKKATTSATVATSSHSSATVATSSHSSATVATASHSSATVTTDLRLDSTNQIQASNKHSYVMIASTQLSN